ncbi:nicotinate (nicotinamide) nucleotide adenylyltransferase [Pseudobutyrivibrio xylanivorans]|uniref:Probable nicotinate-nucleotide adenylyltransferase n=1 Tax=Pseudobutyrivibrio xylanivorans TaxID=185007 RepID=A0A1G5S6P4_PSEXY|nr:nicotinate (nicotinamide) nucleotide adenylyltransferase [Pseudobutyrivibrio xylanivorans]SCZ81401.1 nicotinate-nucleotide adenylyltransferase [Pseudobutyrivibrio xylanivorans]
MRIGIYGGTFNPIHNTHIEIAKAAFDQFKLDRVYILVAGTPPHKDTAESVADTCRLDMVRLAIENIEGLFIDDREIYRSGKSYSYITMTELKNEYPDDDLFFIMGSDSLINFQKWVKPEIISKAATILVAPRLGDDLEELNNAMKECRDIFDGDFELIDYEANGIASSKIRGEFYSNPDVSADMAPQVIDYIKEHNLYSPYNYSYDDVLRLSEEMKKALKPGRYVHTLGVATTAQALALRWNYPAYTAMVAGMLHDCAKCITDEERISICKENDLPISEIEAKYPHLLHGKVGAYFCSSKYDVYDPQIAHAITYHTTGCPNMNLLDKIIFVADYIEPGRDKQPRLDILRATAYTDLDRCVYMILEDSVAYLNNNPDMVDPTTVDTYNYYKQYMKEKR